MTTDKRLPLHPDKCDVCGSRHTIAGVACSGLGAVSFCYCTSCLQYNAEPEGMFVLTYDTCGEDVAPHVRACTTYVNGEYVPWDEWVEDHKKKLDKPS